ncbi:MAG: RCC1-like domain-containing protein, partial [Acidimicrobiales bacterium]
SGTTENPLEFGVESLAYDCQNGGRCPDAAAVDLTNPTANAWVATTAGTVFSSSTATSGLLKTCQTLCIITSEESENSWFVERDGFGHPLPDDDDVTLNCLIDEGFPELHVTTDFQADEVPVASTPATCSGTSGSSALYTWGYNSYGQLGLGTFTGPQSCGGSDPCSTTPAAISALSGVKAFSAGGDFSLALLTNGTVWAWGEDSYYDLGDSYHRTGGDINGANEDLPVEVTYPSGGPLTDVEAISAGDNYALALLGSGEVVGWGYNGQGQLSPKPDNFQLTSPVELVEYPNGMPLSGVTAIAAGQLTSYALMYNGTVMAWGGAGSDELGYASGVVVLGPVAVPGVSDVTAIAAGYGFGLALLRDGSVESWGFNEDSDLGNGNQENQSTPALVQQRTSQGGTVPLTGVKAISANSVNGMALLKNGTVVAWGHGFYGEIGNGSRSDQHTAVSITTASGVVLSGVSAISAGSEDALALMNSGSVMSWGDDYDGQLGNGLSGGGEDTDNPVSVIGLPPVTAISCGGRQSLAQ